MHYSDSAISRIFKRAQKTEDVLRYMFGCSDFVVDAQLEIWLNSVTKKLLHPKLESHSYAVCQIQCFHKLWEVIENVFTSAFPNMNQNSLFNSLLSNEVKTCLLLTDTKKKLCSFKNLSLRALLKL